MQKHYNYLNIDLDKKIHTKLKAKQGDSKSRYILVNLISNSTYYDLSDCAVKIYGIKKDKTIFFNHATVINGKQGQFEVELTTQALAVPGEVEIQILVLGTNDEKLTTFSFFIDVEKTIIDDAAIESTNEFTALTKALSSVQNIDNRFREVDEQFNTIMINVKSFDELKKVCLLKTNSKINIINTINISENIEIPSNLILTFNNNGLLHIQSNITLTISNFIDVGDIQIFSFADDTSKVISKQTMIDKFTSTSFNTKIKLSWFGAKGDAKCKYNYQINDEIIGTDDTLAIKKAVEFAESCSVNYPNLYSSSYIQLEAKPNGQYYVVGDNILGCQNVNNNGVRFSFNGNGCTFYHKPIMETDAFINNARKLNRPCFENFGIRVIGSLNSRKGYFFNTNGGDNFNSCVQGYFSNVLINDFSSISGYNIVFNVEGNNMCDNFVIERCVFINFNKLIYNTNDQAINWLWKKCQVNSNTDNSIYFHIVNPSSGGFSTEDIEVGMLCNNETLVKVEGSKLQQRPIFNISGRIECHKASYTLFDVDEGDFDVRGLNVTYGFSEVINDNSITAKVFKNAFINFNNCTLSENFIVQCIDDDYNRFNNALKFENCSFINNQNILAPYPKIKYVDENKEEITNIYSSSKSFKRIDVIDSRYSNNVGVNLPISYDCQKRYNYSSEILMKKNGKLVIPHQSPSGYMLIDLPPYSLITSLKVYVINVNVEECDTIIIDVLSPSGGIAYRLPVDLNGYVKNTELLPMKDIAIMNNNKLSVSYYKGGTLLDTTKAPYSYLTIGYKNIMSSYEYNNGIVGQVAK